MVGSWWPSWLHFLRSVHLKLSHPPLLVRSGRKGGGWLSYTKSARIWTIFERFPLKESHFRGPQNPKIFRLRRALPPNRAILADILGYLTVFALEIADLGFRTQTTPPRSTPSKDQSYL